MNTKLVKTIREAIALAGLKDGMTISFHHHLRNGDYVLNRTAAARVILRWASPPSMWPLSPRHAPTAWETARESTEDPPAAALDMRSRTRCTQKR